MKRRRFSPNVMLNPAAVWELPDQARDVPERAGSPVRNFAGAPFPADAREVKRSREFPARYRRGNTCGGHRLPGHVYLEGADTLLFDVDRSTVQPLAKGIINCKTRKDFPVTVIVPAPDNDSDSIAVAVRVHRTVVAGDVWRPESLKRGRARTFPQPNDPIHSGTGQPDLPRVVSWLCRPEQKGKNGLRTLRDPHDPAEV